MAKARKVIAPEAQKTETAKTSPYICRNVTLRCLEEAFKYNLSMHHVSVYNTSTRECIDEYREEEEAKNLITKKAILEANGFSYKLFKVKG